VGAGFRPLRVPVPHDVQFAIANVVTECGRAGACAVLGVSVDTLQDARHAGATLQPNALEKIRRALEAGGRLAAERRTG